MMRSGAAVCLSPVCLSHLFVSPVCLSPVCLSHLSVSPVSLSPVSLSHLFVSPVCLSPSVSHLSVSHLSVSHLSLSPVCISPVCISPVCLSPVCISPVCLSPVCLSPVCLHQAGILLDVDGVLLRGGSLNPAARQAFRKLLDRNDNSLFPVVFITNAGSCQRHHKAQQLSHLLEVQVGQTGGRRRQRLKITGGIETDRQVESNR